MDVASINEANKFNFNTSIFLFVSSLKNLSISVAKTYQSLYSILNISKK